MTHNVEFVSGSTRVAISGFGFGVGQYDTLTPPPYIAQVPQQGDEGRYIPVGLVTLTTAAARFRRRGISVEAMDARSKPLGRLVISNAVIGGVVVCAADTLVPLA